MRHHRIAGLLLLSLLAAGLSLRSDNRTDQPREGVPMVATVEPSSVNAGDIATAYGEYLDKTRVLEIYLTRDDTDLRVEIIEQSEKAIRFKVPAKAAPGRFKLTVLMASTQPLLLEQPVSLFVK